MTTSALTMSILPEAMAQRAVAPSRRVVQALLR